MFVFINIQEGVRYTINNVVAETKSKKNEPQQFVNVNCMKFNNGSKSMINRVRLYVRRLQPYTPLRIKMHINL